ncbi:MAG: BrnA antitoxin family protein [Deltaproteobacteria bacterium]|nr:BrnA antitoxin family protein [Deltaproteobacteria bacterium]
MKKDKAAAKRKAELKALASLPDADIDTRAIPEVTDWHGAVRGKFYRPVKEPISIRVDADVLAWFRAQGEKYQSRINEALREYMHQHQRRA